MNKKKKGESNFISLTKTLSQKFPFLIIINDVVFNQKMFHVLNHFKLNLIYIGINSSNHST
jgi:hypothetical protein